MLEDLAVSWSGRSAEVLGGTGKFVSVRYKSISRSFKFKEKTYPER